MAVECADEAGVVCFMCFRSKRALSYCSLEAAADVVALAKVSPKDVDHLGHNGKGVLGA